MRTIRCEFTAKELVLLEVAVRCRRHACEDNKDIPEEKQEARKWKKLEDKIFSYLVKKEKQKRGRK